MRTTINIDDDLLAAARDYLGDISKTELIRLSLQRLVQEEAGRRLAAMGGTDPDAKAPPRRRSKPR